jgi:hypothetical protein
LAFHSQKTLPNFVPHLVITLSDANSPESANHEGSSRENAGVGATDTREGFADDLPTRYRVLFWAIAMGLGLIRAMDYRFLVTPARAG